MPLKETLGEWEAACEQIPDRHIFLHAKSDNQNFFISPTTLVVGVDDAELEVIWVSQLGPFVIQFIDRTPFRSAQFRSTVSDEIHTKRLTLPALADMQAGIFEYAVAIYSSNNAFVHVSGEMSMNPGGGDG